MVLRCWVIYLLLHLTSKVSLQDSAVTTVTRYSFVGGSVTLPCIYGNNLQGNDVYWRYNVSRKVLSIIKGKPSPEKQDKIFSNRTDSFPSEYPKGNYSVVLKDLELTHAGNYTCFLQNSDGEKEYTTFCQRKASTTNSKPKKLMEIQSLKILTFPTTLLILCYSGLCGFVDLLSLYY